MDEGDSESVLDPLLKLKTSPQRKNLLVIKEAERAREVSIVDDMPQEIPMKKSMSVVSY